MKINEILLESTALVSHIYTIPKQNIVNSYNTEAELVASNNKQYYETFFSDFLKYGVTPVFTTSDNQTHTKTKQQWGTTPTKEFNVSPGYLGKQAVVNRLKPNK